MYTRSYSDNIGEIIIPEKYGGTSFVQTGATEEKVDGREDGRNPWEKGEIHSSSKDEVNDAVPTSASPTKGGIGGILSGLFKTDTFTLPKIGKEELIIIATAVFLLFSKEGDKECAIMLLLLLFLG